MLNAVDDRPSRPVPLEALELAALAERWRPRATIGRLLGAWENFVFGVDDAHDAAILRVIEGCRRTEEEVHAELEFIEHLRGQNFPVPAVLSFEDGRKVVTIESGGREFIACLFSEVSGRQISATQILALPAAIKDWGTMIGELHRAGSSFKNSGRRRKRWAANELIADQLHEEGLPEPCRSMFRSILAELRGLSVTHEDFGLVHGDLHGRNVLATDRARTVIDFDDACYHWYSYDLAVAWNWLCLAGGEPASTRENLLTGYAAVRGFSSESCRLLPNLAFLRSCLDFMLVNQRKRSGIESPLIDLQVELLADRMSHQIETIGQQ
jgi:Ser/Thr protein kinase RdoA (MazF antagonist)